MDIQQTKQRSNRSDTDRDATNDSKSAEDYDVEGSEAEEGKIDIVGANKKSQRKYYEILNILYSIHQKKEKTGRRVPILEQR